MILLLAALSGTLGRMGGAHGYESWYRDIGCSTIVIVASVLLWGWQPTFWWAYLLTFAASWAAFSTYWKKLFGKITLWFSGLMVGLAGFPLMFVAGENWWVLPVRALFLMIIWECLNRYLPAKVLCWNRDVVEEFSRYFVSL